MQRATRALALAACLAGVAQSRPQLLQRVDDAPPSSELSLCSPCVQLGEQGVNILLNYVLQAGVVGSCGKLCSHLPQKTEQLVCNLVCDVVGLQAFVKALNHTDLDVIYFCEELHACPAGPDNAAAALTAVQALPATVAKGDTVKLQATVQVTNATGVGEFRVAVNGPVTQPVSQSFLLPQGLQTGLIGLEVSLQIQDDESGDEPVVWSPGNYSFGFHVCQGECGSKHPHSKDFGEVTGTFTLKDAAKVAGFVV